ncbi:hypothetical protein C476_12621 [Natrinema limicola JCM 13563]|uniref:Uncharacterized protein n=1 Tax=Natrinema limicola JCM 13563 TaxID=1230457 RepID=M0CBL9_9EURY|nr:hypothetical protein C476_12621 [Natrinema limicola JCM 13563]
MDPQFQIPESGPVDANETEENHGNKAFLSLHLVLERRSVTLESTRIEIVRVLIRMIAVWK